LEIAIAEISWLQCQFGAGVHGKMQSAVQVARGPHCDIVVHLNTSRNKLIMLWNTLTVGTLLAQSASAQNMLRFGCSQLTVERADPLVTPGMNPAPHTHQIIGGNSFNLTVMHMFLVIGHH
jgi:hypothetical protein